jgi:predicted CoA-substrate-specific enzyme activase
MKVEDEGGRLRDEGQVAPSQVVALGIDVGSTTVKIVGVDREGNLAWHWLEQAEPRVEDQVERFLARANVPMMNHRADGAKPASAGYKRAIHRPLSYQPDVSTSGVSVPLVATGYGRKLVRQATRSVTEITCHAKGVYRELAHGGTLVDSGGQDSKVIGISPRGDVVDFSMNDKCAAGTGRFLENTANRLGVPLERMGQVALSALEEVSISSTCTVFAESEVISLIAHGVAVEPILKGLHRSLIKRVEAMIRTVGLAPPLMLSGGVVQNQAIARMLEEETGEKVVIPQYPQLMGAYGAALVALGLQNSEV